MRKFENKEKKIVYWGKGTICDLCLEVYPEITPHFFIDSHITRPNFGDKLRHPKDITDWSRYYIIITVKSDKAKIEIQNYLKKKGLNNGVDFCTYEDFFMCKRPTTIASVDSIATYMLMHSEITNPVMFQIPFLDVRNYKGFIKFLRSYIVKRGYKRSIVFSNLKVVSTKLASEKLSCSVFFLPNIMDLEVTRKIREDIPKKDYNWLKRLELRKVTDNRERGINESIKIYYYYKTIVGLIKPSKIVIWGNWNKESYILGYLADCYNIPYGYMEHGWISGTYQVDPRGIAGQSEYAVAPKMFKEIEIDEVYDIGKIKQYIKDQKLDTRTFINTKEDESALSRLDKNKKTIFLVGMDDYGMRMNPKNEYWKRYISSTVESTEEALSLSVKICKKNNWNLIFKPHPGNSVPNLEEVLDDIIIVLNMEIDRLIQLADVVVSIVSTVDYKTLIYGKPLVQLGITTLKGKDCTYMVSEKKLFEEQILLALKNGMTKEQIKNFDRLLQILLQKYLWDDMSDRSIRYGLTVDTDFL